MAAARQLMGRITKMLGGFAVIRVPYLLAQTLRTQYELHPFRWAAGVTSFVRAYRKYVAKGRNPDFTASLADIYPCLRDGTATTPIEPVYFYQDTWAAAILFRLRPAHHYDVGSSVKTMAILSQFVPTTMIDIRPPEVSLQNFHFKAGSILALPLEDASIDSLSSLCVVEHIGLGRYGDDLDPRGSEKAIAELRRVLKPGGHLLISVPVDSSSRVYFNAHRAFTREHVLSLFQGMTLIEERYIYGAAVQNDYDRAAGFGTGLFHFVK
jgi:SAM-dependent methyltransferase